MSYIDGFLIPLPKKNLKEYQRQAEAAGKLWMEHGALAYMEGLADDLKTEMRPFPEAAGAKEDETVAFSYIVYKSREHRDEVNKKVMDDPRLKEICNVDAMPFDCKRMAYGGFKAIVEY